MSCWVEVVRKPLARCQPAPGPGLPLTDKVEQASAIRTELNPCACERPARSPATLSRPTIFTLHAKYSFLLLVLVAAEKRVLPPGPTDETFGTGTYMTVTLSCDHRIVDGKDMNLLQLRNSCVILPFLFKYFAVAPLLPARRILRQLLKNDTRTFSLGFVGAMGAKWMGSFKSYMEDPITMIL